MRNTSGSQFNSASRLMSSKQTREKKKKRKKEKKIHAICNGTCNDDKHADTAYQESCVCIFVLETNVKLERKKKKRKKIKEEREPMGKIGL